MSELYVLCARLTEHAVGVHLPPSGFVPPPPDEWGDYPDLRGACGVLLVGDGVAGYGQLDVLKLAEMTQGLHLLYCRLCWPMGPPS